jgi:hypothetical protein
MSILLLRSDSVARCPRHILIPEHYHADGTCQCVPPRKLTFRQKEEQAVSLHECPVCKAGPGFMCLHQNATRTLHYLKYPHPERVQLVDPSLKGHKKYKGHDFRRRGVDGAGWEQSDSRNKNR